MASYHHQSLNMDHSRQPVDPPAYSPTPPAPPTQLRRTIDDTRNIILENAAMFNHHLKVGHMRLVIGKSRTQPAPQPTGRSFVSTTSSVRITVADQTPPEDSASIPPEPRAPGSVSAPRTVGKHYAALVSKSLGGHSTEIIIMGEPQDSVEEALEWMLDKTETIVTEVLATHKRQAVAICCRSCGQAIRGESVA